MIKLEELKCVDYDINLEEYVNFRELVKKNMTNPEWLGDFSIEDLENLLANNSKIWMYYKDDEPVCSMMIIPSTQKDIDKFELDLNHVEVVDYGPMMVNPKYVGNKLQFQMLEKQDEYSSSNGYKYAVSTIHPDNIFSINNFLKDNFELCGQKEFKRGIRNIYTKKL